MKPAKRVEELNKELMQVAHSTEQFKKSHEELIDFSVESPDLLPPFQSVIQLQLSCKQIGAYQYQPNKGSLELREAIVQFYKTKFSVVVHPEEILPLLGSKEGVLCSLLAFLSPGDKVLVPNPGKELYASAVRLAGGIPVCYTLTEAHHWQPDFQELEELELENIKLMFLNYPHEPTGAMAKATLFEDAVQFAQKHHILLINDNSNSLVLDEAPRSLLSVSEAKEVTIELNSFSRAFNMSGWRIGVALGSKTHLAQLEKVKNTMSNGMFLPIQQGAIAAINASSEHWFEKQDLLYANRKKCLLKFIHKLGCEVSEIHTAGIFIWAKIPSAYNSSEEFSTKLLKDKHIFVMPGSAYGSNGEGYVCFSLCVAQENIERAHNRLD